MKQKNSKAEEFRKLQRKSARGRLLLYRVYLRLDGDSPKQKALLKCQGLKSIKDFWNINTIVPLFQHWRSNHSYGCKINKKNSRILETQISALCSGAVELGLPGPLLGKCEQMTSSDTWACISEHDKKMRISLSNYLVSRDGIKFGKSCRFRAGESTNFFQPGDSLGWKDTGLIWEAERALLSIDLSVSQTKLKFQFEKTLRKILQAAKLHRDLFKKEKIMFPFGSLKEGQQPSLSNEDLQAAAWIKSQVERTTSPWDDIFLSIIPQCPKNELPKNLNRDMRKFQERFKELLIVSNFKRAKIKQNSLIALSKYSESQSTFLFL